MGFEKIASSSTNARSVDRLKNPDGSFQFLGTMAGDQVLRAVTHGGRTYKRMYESFGGSDDLRKMLESNPVQSRKSIGEGYSFTPYHLRDDRSFGWSTFNYMQGGGFFLTLGTTKSAWMTSEEYVLDLLASKLEALSGLPIDVLKKQCEGYSIDYLIHHYFDTVDMPEDGDLVVYSKDGLPSHCGIYRNSEPNWNSPPGGTIESKWKGWSQDKFIFQHDIFFVPASFGQVAEFYRLKIEVSHSVSSKSALLTSNEIYTVGLDGCLRFCNSKENFQRRERIDSLRDGEVHAKFPEIVRQKHVHFADVCYSYAFGKILGTFSVPTDIPYLECYASMIVERFFTVTTEPKPGDLVVYGDCDYRELSPKHYGIYLGNGMVESKWGHGSVFHHRFFDVNSNYGDWVYCLELNEGWTGEMLLEELQKITIHPSNSTI